MNSIRRAVLSLVLCSFSLTCFAQASPHISEPPLEVHEHGKPDPSMTKHVLWPTTKPKLDAKAYAKWYKSTAVEWVSEDQLPHVDQDVKVDVFYVTKPVFSLAGRIAGIWHSALCFRVENGPALTFEYTSIDFEAAIFFPPKNASDFHKGLHFPSAAIVDYQIDSSGKICPASGAAWSEITAVGTTSGNSLNVYAKWSFAYGQEHARYLVWRILEPETKRTVIDSSQCADFVFEGLRYLKALDVTAVNASVLPRTVVNVYASQVETLPFNQTVRDFFGSERSALEEWLQLTGKVPLFGSHTKEWYWPAWYSVSWSSSSAPGKLLQDDDYPQTYHRYMLAFPSVKSPTLEYGLHRTDCPVFETNEEVVVV